MFLDYLGIITLHFIMAITVFIYEFEMDLKFRNLLKSNLWPYYVIRALVY